MFNFITLIQNEIHTNDYSNEVLNNLFISYSRDDGRGFHTKRDYMGSWDIRRGIVYLPIDRSYNHTGFCVVNPVNEKENYVLSNFYPLYDFKLDNVDYITFISALKQYLANTIDCDYEDGYVELIKSEEYDYVALGGKYTITEPNEYVLKYCTINDKQYIVLLPRWLSEQGLVHNKHMWYNSLTYGKNFDIYNDMRTYQIYLYLLDNINIYTYFSYDKSREDDKSYILDDDYDFLTEKQVDILNNMIDDGIVYIKFIGDYDDYILMFYDYLSLKILFDKYSLSEMQLLKQFNSKIKYKLGHYRIKSFDI